MEEDSEGNGREKLVIESKVTNALFASICDEESPKHDCPLSITRQVNNP